jgi:cytochrome P450 family 144
LIGNAARLLAENVALQDELRADSNLLAPFLEESLRLESPFRAHHRHVVADTTLGGVDLPAGAHLLLSWGAANRDPAVFDDPDHVRLDRPNIKSHLAFGKGTHFCVGAALARMEARAAIQTLLENTTRFELHDSQWLPSIFVRRHRRLELSVTHGD